MNHGETSYSPDYKSDFSNALRDGKSIAEAMLIANDVSAERARLERSVIEASKAARLAEHEHTKDLTVETWEAMVAAQVLRDSAVDALLTFESEQEKKS